MYYTYLIKSTKQKWIYIGCTDDLNARFNKHNYGEVKSTNPYLPFELVYYEAHQSLSLARRREYELKYHNQQKEVLYKRLEI